MGVRKVCNSIINKFSNKVDDELFHYVEGFVSEDMLPLEKAISIYLALGDILSYSTKFSLLYDYEEVSLVKDISMQNNLIICSNWSILYCKLLRMFGIDSKVVKKNAHYKVEIMIDDVLYSADATGYGNTGFYYSMSDLTRIKYGFRIHKFRIVKLDTEYDRVLFDEKQSDLKYFISNVYLKQNRKYLSDEKLTAVLNKVIGLIYRNANVVGRGSLLDLNYRIKMINRFWRLNLPDSSFEKSQLLNYFLMDLFEDFEQMNDVYIRTYNIYSNDYGETIIYKLLAFEVDDKYYYYLDDGKEFNLYNSKDLVNEFKRRNILLSSKTDIIGLYSDLTTFRLTK